jgi:hypothetical protein
MHKKTWPEEFGQIYELSQEGAHRFFCSTASKVRIIYFFNLLLSLVEYLTGD